MKANMVNKATSTKQTKSKKKRKIDVVLMKEENQKKKNLGKLHLISSSIPSLLTSTKVQTKLTVVSSHEYVKNKSKNKLYKSNFNNGKKKKYVNVLIIHI